MASKEKKTQVTKGESTLEELSRRFHANPFVFIGTIVILLLTIVAFVLVPALSTDGLQGSGKLTFGYYDGDPIDFIPGNYFAQQRDYYSEQYRASGEEQNMDFAAYQIWRAAFEGTVIRTGALWEMEKAGFKTPSELVDRRMAELPIFLENGRFSAAKYRATSDADRLSLRNDLNDQIAMEQYLEDLLGMRIPTKETEFMKSLSSPQRSFDLIAFPFSSYPNSEVQNFITTNPDLFRTIHLSKISFGSAKSDAEKILESINNGSLSFEDAARTHSKDTYADKGGDMGIKYAYELATEIPDTETRNTVLTLTQGSLSEPVEVPNGWALFRVEEAARDPQVDDETVLTKARSYISAFERGRIEDWLFAKAEQFRTTAMETGFGGAALAAALELKSFGPLSINYGDMDLYRSLSSFQIAELSGAATNENFWRTAFSTPLETASNPIVIGDFVIVLNPTSEQSAEESAGTVIDYYYPYIVGQYSENTIRTFFLNNEKLDDNFFETFMQTFMSNS